MSGDEKPVSLSDEALDLVVGGNGIPVSSIPGGPPAGGLSAASVFEAMGAGNIGLEGNIRSFQQTMDPNSQMDLIQLQKMMQDWTVQTQLQSNVVKSIGDALKNTASNLR